MTLTRPVLGLVVVVAASAAACVLVAACMETGPDAPARVNGCLVPDCVEAGPRDGDGGIPRPDSGYPDPLSGTPMQAALVKGGFQFTEGPVWISGKLLFSDTQTNTIHELLPDGGTIFFRENSRAANGNAVDSEGRLVTCEGASRRLVRTNTELGSPTPIAATYMGSPFNEPNDLIARSDGNIYFTDPRYGNSPDGGQNALAVYRLPAGSGLDGAIRLAFDFDKPNGIALSPDENTLYVVDNGNGTLLAVGLNADGTLNGTFQKIADAAGGDGMAVDLAGNLYVAAQAGVVVFDKTGKALGTIALPAGKPANCTFGGADMRTLYITSNNGGGNAATGLYSIPLNVPGRP